MLGTSASDRNRIDRLEMTGVRDEVNVHLGATAGDVFAGRSHVVLNVAAPQNAARVDIFKTGKDFLWGAPGNVCHHVQPATMAHPHNEFDSTASRGRVQDFIHQRKQRGNTFERKTFAAQITLLQNLLEKIGTDEQIECTLLVYLFGFGFHALVDPVAAFRIRDVVDFHPDGAAVNRPSLASILVFNLKIGVRPRTQEAEWIEVAFEVSPLAEGAEDAFALQVGAVGRRRAQRERLTLVFADECGTGRASFRRSHKSSH